eukprot:scaffold1803_cov92-Amphora_coffeaeformis.AAC.81
MVNRVDTALFRRQRLYFEWLRPEWARDNLPWFSTRLPGRNADTPRPSIDAPGHESMRWKFPPTTRPPPLMAHPETCTGDFDHWNAQRYMRPSLTSALPSGWTAWESKRV